MSMCRVVSCVVGKGYLLWTACSLDKTLLAFAQLPFVLQGQTCLLLQAFLDFLLLHSNPLWWKGHLFLVVVLESLIDLQRTSQPQLLLHQWLGYRLGLLCCWTVCLGNKDHSVVFEIVPKYCVSDSSVDYEGYPISLKLFLPTRSGFNSQLN